MKTVLSLVFSLSIAASVARASADGGDRLLLQILQENGVITEQQKAAVWDEYEKRVSNATEIANTAAAQTEASKVVVAQVEPSLPQPIVRKKRAFTKSLTIGGRLHPQFDFLSSSLKNSGRSDPSANNRFHIRRAFLSIGATFDDHWRGTYLTDLSDSKVVTQIARITWTLNDANNFQFGYQKVPFGYEETTPSTRVKPIERSASTRFWNEQVGFGSFHSGAFYNSNWGGGWKSTFAVTNNEKGESDKATSDTNDLATYFRVQKSTTVFGDDKLVLGLDIGQDNNGNGSGQDVFACGVHGDWSLGANQFTGEYVWGELDRAAGGDSNASSWYLQASRHVANRWEIVGRVSSIDTDGFGANLASVIRRAPASGFRYDTVDSLYLGANLFLRGNNVKFSVGYEFAEGKNAISDIAAESDVEETIYGMRSRLQFLF